MPRRSALRLVPGSELDAGREALDRYDWQAAKKLFANALEQDETPEAYEGLGAALCWLGRIREALEQLEHAFRLYRERGDRRSAARIAILIAVDSIGTLGEEAVGNGWLGRAHRLLEDLDPGAEHAWIALWEAHLALLIRDDLAASRPHLARGRQIARDLDLEEVEAFADGLEGLVLIAEGRVNEGFRKLDSATTAAVTGELRDLQAIGQAYCYTLRACEQVQDFARAAQWCRRAVEVSRRVRVRFYESYCRNHYAAVLIWRGEWDKAEAELETLVREMRSVAPTVLPEAAARLGELRRRQGRWEEAAELFVRSEGHPFSSLGRASLALDRGDAEAALDLVERHLRAISAQDRVQRAPGWAVEAAALTALGRFEEAAEAAARLAAIAQSAGTAALSGSARAAAGRLAAARGDLPAARRDLEDAVDLFERSDSPYEAGRSRTALGRVLADSGLTGRAEEELRAAIAGLGRIGARREREAAEAVLAQVAAPAGGGRRTVDGLTPRQVEVLTWIARGLGNRQIGERLFVSEFTVKRHVADILATLDLPTRAAAAAYAVRRGLAAD